MEAELVKHMSKDQLSKLMVHAAQELGKKDKKGKKQPGKGKKPVKASKKKVQSGGVEKKKQSKKPKADAEAAKTI